MQGADAKHVSKMKPKTFFETEENSDIYHAPDLTGVIHIYLKGPAKVDFSAVKLPATLKYLCCYFRPDFRYLPETLEELEIVTQRTVWRVDLPTHLKKLHVQAPNSIPTTFELDPEDGKEEKLCAFYYISVTGIGKYNVFKQGYWDAECDNSDRHKGLMMDYQVDGDCESGSEEYERNIPQRFLRASLTMNQLNFSISSGFMGGTWAVIRRST